MKAVYFVIFLFGFKAVQAHNPDLSSLMIYEQNGKSILLIKSSLTAFEGEVNFIFGKESYKTPEEFNQLLIQHFQKNCLLIADGEIIKFSNVQVQLGHETNLFAELDNLPKTINSFYIKNALFKDMPNNMCELILTVNGLPQKQYILNKGNQQKVTLNAEKNKWMVVETASAFNLNSIFLIGAAVLLIVSFIVFAVLKRKRQPSVLEASF